MFLSQTKIASWKTAASAPNIAVRSARSRSEINQDRAGAIRLSTDTGLYGVDSATGKTVHYEHNADDPATLSSNIVRSTLETQGGTLYVATTAGLDTVDRRTGKVARRVPFATPNSEWTKIVQDHAGIIWLPYNEKHGGWQDWIPARTSSVITPCYVRMTKKLAPGWDSGEGERLFRRERERHSGPKPSVATLAFRLCRKCSASSRKTVRSEA